MSPLGEKEVLQENHLLVLFYRQFITTMHIQIRMLTSFKLPIHILTRSINLAIAVSGDYVNVPWMGKKEAVDFYLCERLCRNIIQEVMY